MGIEGGDLVDFGHGDAEFFGQSAHVSGGKVAVGILDQVQKFDQKIALAWSIPQKGQDFGVGAIIKLAAFWRVTPLALAGLPDTFFAFVQRHFGSPAFSRLWDTLDGLSSPESTKSDVSERFSQSRLAMRVSDARLVGMRWLLLMILCVPSMAFGEDRSVSPSEFESIVTGRTLSYSTRGAEYGAEEYFEGRRVRWSYLDGNCEDGEWYPQGAQVCFVYDALPSPQCWQFYLRDGRLLARFENNPLATELYELDRREEPLMCLGPKIGV